MAPALFVAICRQALYRFSRKTLLERVPSERHDLLEESLSFKDEYQETLETLGLVVRLTIVLCLAVGRWSTLDVANFEKEFGGQFGGQIVNLSLLGCELLVLGVLFLHLIPTVVARVTAESWLLLFLPLMERLYRMTVPVRKLSDRLGRVVALPFGEQKERTSADIVEEEILSAVEEGQREGLLESRDIDMIESIMKYGDIEVSEVMTPRTEMVTLDLEETLETNLQRVIDCGHSRIPVVRGNKDKVVGVLYVKDLQKYWLRKEDIALEQIVRDSYFVSHNKKIGELLQEFKGHRQHLAVVQDEHGGTAGLVTIEDILEEIVGEISDEYETEKPLVRRISRDLAEVDAAVHIDDLNEQLETTIPEGETYDTVGGYLIESLGKVPAVGDTFKCDSVRFEVIAADDRRVHRLRLHLGLTPQAT